MFFRGNKAISIRCKPRGAYFGHFDGRKPIGSGFLCTVLLAADDMRVKPREPKWIWVFSRARIYANKEGLTRNTPHTHIVVLRHTALFP